MVDRLQDGDVLTAKNWNSVASSVSFLRGVNNEQMVAIARNQFEFELSELGYNGGFFDILRDVLKFDGMFENLRALTLDGGDDHGVLELDLNTDDPMDTEEFYGETDGYDDNFETGYGYNLTVHKDNCYITQVAYSGRGSRTGDVRIKITQDGDTLYEDVRHSSGAEKWEIDPVDYERALVSGSATLEFIYEGGNYNGTDNTSLSFSGNLFDASWFGDETTPIDNGYDDIVMEQIGYYAQGSAKWKTIDFEEEGFEGVPNEVVVSDNVDIPEGTGYDLHYTLTDGDGNTETVNRADVGGVTELSSFTSSEVEVGVEFSGEEMDTPRLYDVAFSFNDGGEE